MGEDGKLAPDPAQPLEPVLAAYAEAGTYDGAARLLNARMVPSRALISARRRDPGLTGLDDDGRLVKGYRWSDMSVRLVVARAGMAPNRNPAPGRPAATAALLAKVLRCHCGGPMTPTLDRVTLADGTPATYRQYLCWRARHDPDHGRPVKVAESALLPWIREEAARLRPPAAVDTPDLPRGTLEPRDELMDRRQRVLYQHGRRYITDVELDAEIDAIDAALERLDAAEWAVQVVPPAIDWNWPTEQLNAVLRALWDHVQLDAQLRPTSAEWHVPEWRA
jgi:hypothetical protein